MPVHLGIITVEQSANAKAKLKNVARYRSPIWKKEHWADGSSSWVSIGACEQSGQDC